jgi:hypothetical protein
MSNLTSLSLLDPAPTGETDFSSATSITEARESLAYWRGRLERLPWHRRAARAEARDRVSHARRRLVAAQLERWQLGFLLAPLLALLAARERPLKHARLLGLLALRRSQLARRLLIAATAASLAAVALLAVMASQLL